MIRQGTIVWAVVSDKNGHNAYGRPVIIVTHDAEIAGSEKLVGVVASHTAAQTRPRPESYLELPWHPSGRTSTRLRKPTVAVCEWLTVIERGTIADSDVGGRVPATVIERILYQVRRIHGDQRPE